MKQLTGIVAKTKGSAHYGIKPYFVFVYQPLLSKKSHEVMLFECYCKFKQEKQGGEVSVQEDSKVDFNIYAIEYSMELQELVSKYGGVFPTSFLKKINVTEIVRRGGCMGTVNSECPAFKKHWDPSAIDCKECAKVFFEEYTACKGACEVQKVQTSEVPVSSANLNSRTHEGAKVETNIETVLQRFRKGSRANVLMSFLVEQKKTSIDEATQFVAKTCNISQQKALENIKGYLWEWKKGEWGGKKLDLPFEIFVEENRITCKEKSNV